MSESITNEDLLSKIKQSLNDLHTIMTTLGADGKMTATKEDIKYFLDLFSQYYNVYLALNKQALVDDVKYSTNIIITQLQASFDEYKKNIEPYLTQIVNEKNISIDEINELKETILSEINVQMNSIGTPQHLTDNIDNNATNTSVLGQIGSYLKGKLSGINSQIQEALSSIGDLTTSVQNIISGATTVANSTKLNNNTLDEVVNLASNGYDNILINGNFIVNQKSFNGNWSTLADGEYGYDMWKKNGTNIVQIIESINYKPSTIYTLTGTNVITQQFTSPLSGNWTITVPNTATNIRLQEGNIAKPSKFRLYGVELPLCQRYFWRATGGVLGSAHARISTTAICSVKHPVPMRAVPTVSSNTTTNLNRCHFECGNLDFSNLAVALAGGTNGSKYMSNLSCTNSSAVMPIGQGGNVTIENDGYIDFSAQL